MEVLSYILSISGLISMACASLIKGEKMKKILFLLFWGNALVATGYLVGESGISGAVTCYFGCVMLVINYLFECRQMFVPKWVMAIYFVVVVLINIWATGGITTLGIIVILASFAFILCIGQKSGAKYRFWVIVNLSLWCIYDFLSGAYSIVLTHGAQLIFAVVGVIIHDRKNILR